MKRSEVLAISVGVVLILGGGAFAMRARLRGLPLTVAGRTPAEVPRAPEGVRVRVQVVNTTRIPGLARRATRVLRDQGFDVVEVGGAGPALDSTLVLDRSFHPEWAATVAKILGPATHSESRPDSSRYLDVTVLLGSTWRPASPALVP